MVRLAILASVFAVSACLSHDVELGDVVQAIVPPPCPQDDCGNGNSPVIDGVYFWHLNSYNIPDQGVAISSVARSDGTPMRLVAHVDQLLGVHPVTGVTLAAGVALEGTRIIVSVDGLPYQIRIRYVSPTFAIDEAFWVGTQTKVEAYDFVYTPLFGLDRHERPLCSLANGDVNNPMIRAIVFTGDNYDPVSKDITLGAATVGWMNIACKKSAPYKMHLIGHTTAAWKRLGIWTPLDKRKSMLNAWTMNACGTGTAFTVPGTKITLTESQYLLPPSSEFQKPSSTDEAIWGPDGARCLDMHRLATDDESNKLIISEIEKECGHSLPSCGSYMGDWDSHGYVVTGSP